MKQIISFLLIFSIFFFSCPVALASGGAFLMMDGRTGEVLEQESGDLPLPMASTTKVMTALVALEQVGLSEQVEIPPEAAGIEGSSLYMKAGERYSVEELLYGLLLRSANDCAEALAWYAGGKNRAHFIALMNQKAKALGLENTKFQNPSGLSEEGHYTTAHDLALIMKAAMEQPTFAAVSASKSADIKGQRVVNHNKLLSLYEHCIGGKTGYTMAAGRCLVSVAKDRGVPLICVTLGRRDDWNIHTVAYEKWFARLKEVPLAEAGDCRVEIPVAGGGVAMAVNSHSVSAFLFADAKRVDKKIVAPHFLYGNQAKGEVVGSVEYRLGGALLGEAPLILKEEISAKMKKELFISRLFRFFRQIFLKKR